MAKPSKSKKAKTTSKARSNNDSMSWLHRNVSHKTFGMTLFALFFGMIGVIYITASYAMSIE